jgi:hypothetical protein
MSWDDLSDEPVVQKPVVELAGTDGDVYALAGRAGQALARAGRQAQRTELYDRVLSCDIYAQALRTFEEYVELR